MWSKWRATTGKGVTIVAVGCAIMGILVALGGRAAIVVLHSYLLPDAQAASRLLRSFNTRDRMLKLLATNRLVQMRPSVIPHLRASLMFGAADEREGAAEVLDRLMQLSGSSLTPQQRSEVLEALRFAFHDQNEKVQAYAARIYWHCEHDTRVLPFLMKSTLSADETVSYLGIDMIARIGPDAAELLLRLLELQRTIPEPLHPRLCDAIESVKQPNKKN